MIILILYHKYYYFFKLKPLTPKKNNNYILFGTEKVEYAGCKPSVKLDCHLFRCQTVATLTTDPVRVVIFDSNRKHADTLENSGQTARAR